MKNQFRLFWVTAFAAQLAGGVGQAQDAAFGGEIYKTYCAVCHGKAGAGDGMVGELFAQRPANLKHLSRGNGGVFPTERVTDAIYGRGKIAGHGPTKMPIWGGYFMAEALESRAIDPAEAAMITKGRVLSVVAYLETLQEE